MALIDWKKDFSVQVDLFDKEHQNLIDIINNLHDGMKNGKSKEIMENIINDLIKYSKTHFSDEEKYMERYNYPGIEEQKKAHKIFIDKINQINDDFKSGKIALSMEIMQFLKEWWRNHIIIIDKKYGDFFNEKGLK